MGNVWEIIWQLLLIFGTLKKKKFVHLIFQKLIRTKKKKDSLNDSKWKNEGWHYLAVKKLSALLHGITSKHDAWIGFILLEQKINVMPSEKNNILKFNQYMKSDKMSYIIYADIEL